jgi:hypothetical protein
MAQKKDQDAPCAKYNMIYLTIYLIRQGSQNMHDHRVDGQHGAGGAGTSGPAMSAAGGTAAAAT